MATQTVQDAWDRIEGWCEAKHPELLLTLNPGASETELSELEKNIEHTLPPDLRISLSIHNGQASGDPRFLFGWLSLLTCESITTAWGETVPYEADIVCYPDKAIRPCYGHTGWIPIADEVGTGNYLAVDLSPGPTGTVGQVIDFGADIHSPGVMAPGWGEFLQSYADLLETLSEPIQDSDHWRDTFHEMWKLNVLDSLVYWARDGRWPLVKFEESWRSSTVIALAQQISSTRDFTTMPILADALQDAGCDSAAVLKHCRDRECRHAKGCWVIDSLLTGRVENQRWCCRS
ncbi:MAG: SMI1/KNR4 family protein [Gemmataceae bacterium]